MPSGRIGSHRLSIRSELRWIWTAPWGVLRALVPRVDAIRRLRCSCSLIKLYYWLSWQQHGVLTLLCTHSRLCPRMKVSYEL